MQAHLMQQRLVAEQRWMIGSTTRMAPAEVMAEIFRALRAMDVSWKKLGPYNLKCLYKMAGRIAAHAGVEVKMDEGGGGGGAEGSGVGENGENENEKDSMMEEDESRGATPRPGGMETAMMEAGSSRRNSLDGAGGAREGRAGQVRDPGVQDEGRQVHDRLPEDGRGGDDVHGRRRRAHEKPQADLKPPSRVTPTKDHPVGKGGGEKRDTLREERASDARAACTSARPKKKRRPERTTT